MRGRRIILGGITVVALFLSAAPVHEGDRAEAGTRGLTFRKPVLVSADDSQTAAEPSIRAARDGKLYIVAPTGLGNVRTNNESGGADVVWRSDDRGRTWTFLGSLDNQQGGGDADIAPTRNGKKLWAAGLTLLNTTGAISTDRGESWTTNPINTLSAVVDRQWIETYKNAPFAFLTTGRIGDSSILLSRLEDVGGVPATSNTITVSGDEPYQWPGEIAVDERKDFVYVTYNTSGDPRTKDGIMVARTDLELGRKKLFKVTTTKGDSFDSFTAIDVDRAGNVYVVWTERRPRGEGGSLGKTNSYLAVSKNSGKSWSRPVRLNKRPRTTVFPWVVAGSKGRVAVAYYGIRMRGPSPEDVQRPGGTVPKWKVWTAYSLNAHKATPRWREAKALPRGTYLHEGNVCTSGTGCSAGTRDLLDFFQLDLDTCGKIVITYTDNSRDVVTSAGRQQNVPELVAFISQRGGPRFYSRPLNASVC